MGVLGFGRHRDNRRLGRMVEMKIVDLDTFRSMPSGTVFMKYEPCVFDLPQIKGGTWEHDFASTELAPAIFNNGTDDLITRLDDAEKFGARLTLDYDYYGRDGCFDKDQLFAVYEREDLEQMVTELQRCIKEAY